MHGADLYCVAGRTAQDIIKGAPAILASSQLKGGKDKRPRAILNQQQSKIIGIDAAGSS